MDVVSFTQMRDGTREDYIMLHELESQYAAGTADRLLAAMETLSDSLPGYRITRLDHSLQAASRAWTDGADDDWIVAALLHDMGDVYAPYNHDEYSAAILRPFVREQCTWTVQVHADFQMIYYGHHIGADQHKRDRHRDSPYFDDCADFCERWDQSSFDPAFRPKPLDFFAPILRSVFARPANDPQIIQPGKRMPLIDPAQAEQRATLEG